eukprot:6958067-Alexandrium_andersonii.AAC.1
MASTSCTVWGVGERWPRFRFAFLGLLCRSGSAGSLGFAGSAAPPRSIALDKIAGASGLRRSDTRSIKLLPFWASASAGGAEKGHGCSGSLLATPLSLTASSHRTSVRSL